MSHKNPTRFLGSQTSLTLLVSLLVVGMLPAPARGDDPIPGYLNQIEASRLTTVASDLTTLYGPRRHDTYSPYTGANCVISSTVYPKSTIAMSEDYLKAQFLAMGYEASAITLEEVPQGVGHNVYVTKIGNLYPNVFLEVGAHYDTINGSPGGSDNAAAVALVVELARVLKDYPSRYSIRFALWVAEEYDSQRGAYFGSTYHVQQALARGEQIKAGLNSDVIGWADPGSPTYYMNEVSYLDAESERIANLFQKAAADYGIAIGFRKNRAILPSDQWAYWNQNLPAVVSMGGWLTGHPNYHGCGDTAANIDFVNVLRTTQQNLVVLLWLDAEGNTSTSTTTSLESAPNPSLAGQSVTLTAAVRAAVGTASGTVEFREGAVSLGTALLNAGGVAAMTTSSLAVGTHSLTAVYGGDQSHDGSTSVPLTHSVYLSGSPAPAISSLAPGSVIAGGAAFSLTVTGGNFVANSVVRWNGAERATTYVSASELRATIPAADIASPGSALVSVFTPAPGGGASAALTLAITNPQAAPAGVLLAAYNMDEGSGAVLHDRSGNANDGSLLNGVAWTTGRYGTAISLDGVNDYVQMPNSPALELSGKNLTLEFWANVQSGGTAWDYVILNKPWNSGQMNHPYYQYGVEFYGSSREFVFFFGGAFGYREFRMAASYDTWHHVAFTYDGSNVRGYLNGVQRFSTPETESLTVRGTNLLLGVDGQLQQPFKGRLDDLRIYSRALSAAEIQADMNTPVASAGAPAITGFSPTSGPAGTVVTISGSGFTGATAVRFNGVNAQAFTVVSDGGITATVPAAAGTGAVSVVAPGGTAQSAGVFTFVTAPAITGFSPTSGPAGTVVAISGSGFTGATAVRFNGVNAQAFTVVSDGGITATVPAAAGTGAVSVVAPGGTAQSAGVFTFVTAPAITGFSPTSGPAGTVVAISGSGFTGATAVRFNGVNAQAFTVVSDGGITATVPAAAGTGAVSVVAPGGTAQSAGVFTFVTAPAITGFSPTSGPAGTVVTISGSGFTGATAVRFNGVNAQAFTVVSDGEITATVPAAAGTGAVSVVAPGGTAQSAGVFTFVTAPAITGFSPTSGPAGTVVTISGSGFTGATAVRFNGVNAQAFTVVSDGEITATVPAAAGTGAVSVVAPGGTAQSAGVFTFVTAPAITGFSPTSGPAGTVVAISGSGFTGATAVRFNGVNAQAFTVVSDGGITATVPAAAGTGAVSVVAPGGTAQSAGVFTFVTAPAITGFSPTSGPAGTVVAISGSGFTGATAVRFNGVNAQAFTVVSDGGITATVPAAAGTGAVSVVAPGGTAQSAGVFTFVTAPAITGFSPTSGPAGTVVAISGSGFTGATAVRFNGVNAQAFTVVSDGGITATVPAAAGTGAVSVVAPGGTAQSAGVFTFVTAPAITGFSPTSGPAGTVVAISGSGFTGATAVRFNGVNAQAFTVVSDGGITATVPAAAGTGAVSVVAPGGTAQSAGVFTFVTAPAITGFSPTSGPAGTVVAISGSGFTGATAVRFNGVNAQAFTVVSDGGITATVPAAAGTGAVSVVAPGGTAQSAGVFTFITAPAITGFSPTSGPAGTVVAISGSGFTGATAVRFNGVNAQAFTVVSDGGITATVPAAAGTGAVSVVAPGGTVTSAGVFSFTGDVIRGYLNQIEASRLTTVASDLTTLYGPRRHDTYSPYTGANCVISSTVYPKSTIAMSEDYLKAQFLAMGYEASAITLEEVPQGVGHNVYVTKIGNLYPNVFLEVGAHYDTINGSPGGSDNAAAVALVVELARVLKDYPSRYSIRFALWVAEEYDSQRGAYFGSTYHVQQALARGEQIKAGLNSDVIGWADPGSPTYYMNEVSYLDAESERIANLFQKAAADYGIAIGFRKNRAILPSDQWAYWNQNLPAVVSMGGWLTGHPNYHGCGDTAANIDFVNVLRTTQQNLVVLLWLDAEGNTSTSTTTSLESAPNPSLAGQSVTLTAAVRAAVGTASGTVEFREGAVSLGTALLNAGGVAAMTTSSLAVGTHSLTAVYGGDQSHDGSTSVPLTHSVYLSGSPAPAISSLAPGSVIAGGAAFSLTVTGGNFVANSVVRWNGAERATTYVSASELRATIPAADIASPGSALVSVFTPAPGGGASAALTLAITNPQAAPAGVLLAAYNMDEGSGAVLHDRSGNANDGSLLNGVAWTTGRYGTAISLDGVNDYVQMPNSPALELSGKNLTLEFWANVQSGGTAWDYVILNKPWNSGQMNHPYYQYGVEFYGSSREFVFFFGGAFGYREFRMAASYDTWHHVAFTYDGSNVRGYLNGVQRFSTPETESLTVRGTNLLLGVDGQLQQPFKGRLDDLRIYSRALSAAEIQADMNTPVASAGAPAITGFSPTSGPAGTVVTISGSGFTGATAVRFNGVNAQAFTVVSDGGITATVPAAAGTGAVSVVAPGGTAQSAGVFTFVTAPVISSLSPSQATAGGASFVLTVTGENFVPSSVVRWNGADRGTTFVSGTQLQASIPASDITTAGAALVSVHTPTAGGGTSGTLVFTVGNPVPSISSLSPTSTAAGGPSFTLTVNGAGFVSGSTVRWKGEDRPTSFVSATRLTATISGADIAGSGTAAVTVFTPAPGGGTSASRSFTINNPVPAIVSLNPSSVAAQGPAFTLTVTGSGFVPTSVVRWNSSNRTTTYVSPTQLTAAITSSDIARATTAQITVRNPTPGGGTSNAVGLTVRP